MIGHAALTVTIGDGMFRSERAVLFDSGGVRYNLIVDEGDVVGPDKIRVQVLQISEGGERSLVLLPRETFTTSSKLWVDSALIAQEAIG